MTKQTAVIQAEHVLRALENATARIGRALTVHAEPRARSRVRSSARALGAAGQAYPDLLAEITARSPAGAVPRVPAVRGAAAARDRLAVAR